MGKRRQVRPIFLYLGAATLALAAWRRRDLRKGASIVSDAFVKAGENVVETLIAKVGAAASNIPRLTGAAYAALPMGPPEIGPLAAENRYEALASSFQETARALTEAIDKELELLGVRAKVAETKRTAIRQLFLWGIGRLYQALGRTGPVTAAKEPAQGAHPKGLGIDYIYVYRETGKKAPESLWLTAVQRAAPGIQQRLGVRWGGTFKRPDTPHWEAADWKTRVV